MSKAKAEPSSEGPSRPCWRAVSIARRIARIACGIFGADIDVAAGGADGETGDRHALDQHEGVALHHHPVGEGAAVALVGVADDIFLCGGRRRGGPPLDAGREAGAAAAAQTGGENLLDRVGRTDRDSALEAGETAMSAIVVDRLRIGDAAAGEGEPRLALEETKLVDEADAARMVRPGEGRVEDRGKVGGGQAGIAHPPLLRFHFEQRLQLEHAARAVAHDSPVDAALPEQPGELGSDLVRADRAGGGVAGYEESHADALSRARSASRRIDPSSSRAKTSSPTMADGPLAHRPRQ